MSTFYVRGHLHVPPEFYPDGFGRPLNFDEARRVAWLMAGPDGRLPQAPQLRRKPRRASLPDVDFSAAVPDPDHVPLLARLADALRVLAGWLDRLSGNGRGPLGESGSTPYIAGTKGFSGRIHSRAA